MSAASRLLREATPVRLRRLEVLRRVTSSPGHRLSSVPPPHSPAVRRRCIAGGRSRGEQLRGARLSRPAPDSPLNCSRICSSQPGGQPRRPHAGPGRGRGPGPPALPSAWLYGCEGTAGRAGPAPRGLACSGSSAAPPPNRRFYLPGENQAAESRRSAAPSFRVSETDLPPGVSSSTPAHTPSAKCVAPT